MNRVSVALCQDYHLKRVATSVRQNLEHLGGMSRFVQPGQKVLLKINLLTAAPPEKAVTTHPAVVLALSNLVREAGGHPLVADSPGPIPFTEAGLRKAYRAAGYLELEGEGSLQLNWDTVSVGLPYAAGKVIKRFEVIRPVVETDIIIAVPKLKTHMFTTFTGATKVLFGVIPGLAKAGYYGKLQKSEQFAEMLLDLIGAVRPSLYVMDGILGLEGDGPGLHGQPRPVGVILAAQNPAPLDAVACSIVGINPLEVPMLQAAVNRGWWDGSLESLQVSGASLESVAVKGFKKPSRVARDARGLDRLTWYQRICTPLLKTAFSPRPMPSRRRCSGCGTCRHTCPQQAVRISRGRAVIDDRACIRCYCCHEMCPEAAIDLTFGLLGQTVRRFGLLGRREE